MLRARSEQQHHSPAPWHTSNANVDVKDVVQWSVHSSKSTEWHCATTPPQALEQPPRGELGVARRGGVAAALLHSAMPCSLARLLTWVEGGGWGWQQPGSRTRCGTRTSACTGGVVLAVQALHLVYIALAAQEDGHALVDLCLQVATWALVGR